MFELTAEQKLAWQEANQTVHCYTLAQALETQLARALKAEHANACPACHEANYYILCCIREKPLSDADWLAEARWVLETE